MASAATLPISMTGQASGSSITDFALIDYPAMRFPRHSKLLL
jgi:hypothetical protein